MWFCYVDFWMVFIGGGNECVVGVYGCFVNEFFNFCITFDFGIVTFIGEDLNSE